MIIFFESGRLGNQIFQFAFLKTIQKNKKKIVLFGFDDLFKVFDIKDENIIRISLKNRVIRKFVLKILEPLLNKIADLNIINTIKVKHEKVLKVYRRETTEYNYKRGIISNVLLVQRGYFQSELFFDKNILSNVKIKELYIKEAKDFLRIYEKFYRVFVHIRRGDYKDFKVYGKNTLLPMNYFHNQIKWFLENRDNCYFIFLSDEPNFIEEEFDYLENKIVSKNNYEVDFAIMTLCNGAILSPSSFGWWGSYMMKDRDIVFAPKYWLGFESKMDYHDKSIASFMKEIEV